MGMIKPVSTIKQAVSQTGWPRILRAPWWMIFWGLLLFGVQACTPKAVLPPPKATTASLTRLQAHDYPAIGDDMAYDGLAHALGQSIQYYQRVPSEKEYPFGDERFTAAHMLRSCQKLLELIRQTPDPKQLNAAIYRDFFIYKAAGRKASRKVLYTGYFEPILNGSLEKSDRYRYPVYGRPPDLVTANLSAFFTEMKTKRLVGRVEKGQLVPYPDRHQIDRLKKLDGRAPVVAWVEDPIALFFLHIQGSGRVMLAEGGSIPVLYNGTNGRAYRSIGKLLIEENHIPREQMSMQAIRAYLKRHPEEIERIFDHNPSYVFFRTGEGEPLGSIGVPVTAGRSIATDRRIFPPGAPAFMVTQIPLVDGSGRIDKWVACRRLVVNQDTGGAIKGPGRADLFWGRGPYAEAAAGHMRHDGDLYFLALRPS